ncbi:MAG: FtsX-like permease family protein [Pseudoclavibacter sp.]
MKLAILLLREAAASCVAQKATSFLTVLTIAGMCVAIVLTSGRVVGSQRDVLESVDSVGTRAVVVRGAQGSGLDTAALARIAQLDGVEWIGGFSSPTDATDGALNSGARVSVRTLFTDSPSAAGIKTLGATEGVHLSGASVELLGLDGATGYLVEPDSGLTHSVVGVFDPPPHLEYLDPVAIAPRSLPSESVELALLVIVARQPTQVGQITEALQPLLGVADASKIQISGSEELANLRATLESQLGAFGRTSVIGVTTLAVFLVFLIQQSLVVMRRKDFGRRRALGARRSMIVQLLILQTSLTSIVGAGSGSLLAWFILSVFRSPQPPLLFFFTVAVLATCIGGVASVVPAVLASVRDPIRELRVP